MIETKNMERRKHIRAKRILSIEYRLYKGFNKRSPENNWRLSTTHDMSVGGVSFYSEKEYFVDDVLEVSVIMSGLLEIFKGYGKVRRIEKKKTGAVFFIALELLDKKAPAKRISSDKTKAKKRI